MTQGWVPGVGQKFDPGVGQRILSLLTQGWVSLVILHIAFDPGVGHNRKEMKKADNKLRWKFNSPELKKLRDLIPEADMEMTERRVLLHFLTRAALHRCLDHILAEADEDLLPVETLRQWSTSWSFDIEGLKVVRSRQTWHLSREAVGVLISSMRTPVPGR